MSIAPKIRSHLDDNGVAYAVVSHPHTASSQRTAEEAHISGEQLAKAVLLERDDGERLLAVLPASRVVHYPEVDAHLGSRTRPVEEQALQSFFPDCELGALPPFGAVYGLETIVDEALFDEDPLYFEAGDHRSVVRVSTVDFRSLLFGADCFSFSARPR